jgi:hypothetical protein
MLWLFARRIPVRNSEYDLIVIRHIQPDRRVECVVVGLLLTGIFLSVILAYALTEYLLKRLDVRRRVLVDQSSPLLAILGANAGSFLVVWISSLALMFAADVHMYYYATLVCLCAQGVWLTQHLWSYCRGHGRLHYE